MHELPLLITITLAMIVAFIGGVIAHQVTDIGAMLFLVSSNAEKS